MLQLIDLYEFLIAVLITISDVALHILVIRVEYVWHFK